MAGSEIAQQALREMREILSAPAPEERWWSALNKGERTTLLRHALLDEALYKKPWCAFPPAQRYRLQQAASRIPLIRQCPITSHEGIEA